MKIKKYLKMLLLLVLIYPISVFAEDKCFTVPGTAEDKILIPTVSKLQCTYKLQDGYINKEYYEDSKGKKSLVDRDPLTKEIKLTIRYVQGSILYEIDGTNTSIQIKSNGDITGESINQFKIHGTDPTKVTKSDASSFYGCPTYITFYEYYHKNTDYGVDNLYYSGAKSSEIIFSKNIPIFDSNPKLQDHALSHNTTANRMVFLRYDTGTIDDYPKDVPTEGEFDIYYYEDYFLNPKLVNSSHGYDEGDYEEYINDDLDFATENYNKRKNAMNKYCGNSVSGDEGPGDTHQDQQLGSYEKVVGTTLYHYGMVSSDKKCSTSSVTFTYVMKYENDKIKGLEIRTPGYSSEDTTYLNSELAKIDYSKSDWYRTSEAERLIIYDPSTQTVSGIEKLYIIYANNKRTYYDEKGYNAQGITDATSYAVTDSTVYEDLCGDLQESPVGQKVIRCRYYNVQAPEKLDHRDNIILYTKVNMLEEFDYMASVGLGKDVEFDVKWFGYRKNDVGGKLVLKILYEGDVCPDLLYYDDNINNFADRGSDVSLYHGGTYAFLPNYSSTSIYLLNEDTEYNDIKKFCTEKYNQNLKVHNNEYGNYPMHYCANGKCKTETACYKIDDSDSGSDPIATPTTGPQDPDIFEVDENGCPKIIKLPVTFLKKVVFNVLEIFIPIILIVMASVDLVKYLLNPDDDKKHQTLKKCMNKFIIAIMFFFITTIVSLILNRVARTTPATNTSSWKNCWNSIK